MNSIEDLKDIEIHVTLNEKSNMLAQVEIVIGKLSIKGFRVLRTEEEGTLYVQPPSIRSRGGNYIWICKVNDLQLWKELEEKIKRAYINFKKHFDAEIKDIPVPQDTINPDDIPF